MTITNTANFNANTATLAQMIAVAQVSMDWWHAEVASSMARDEYIQSIQEYEHENGCLKWPLSADAPEHAAVREYTAKTYAAHKASKRKVYTAKRKLENACAKLTIFKALAG